MQKTWSYKNYEIKEGLKPGNSQFRAMSRFDPSKDFNSIVSSQIETWHEWVKEKIDAAEFRNRALKFEKTGEKEIDLSEMTEHVRMD